MATEAQQTTPEQRMTAITKITRRNYKEEVSFNEDKSGKVSVFHDAGMFSPSTLVNFLALSKRIGKEICLVSWPNHESIKYVKGKIGKRKKVYFFLFGEPELEPYFSEPYSSDFEAIHKYSRDGSTKLFKYWTHNRQLENWSDYFQIFDLSGNGSRCSVNGQFYHFASYKMVTISLSSLLMNNVPEEVCKYAITEIINSSFSYLKASRERRNYEKIADDFLDRYKVFSITALKQAPQLIESKISDLLERMRSNYVAINNAEREIETNKHLLIGARKNIDNFEDYFKKESQNLKTVLISSFKNKFKDISFDGSYSIIATTKPIYINCVIPTNRNGDGVTERRFLIGEFRIIIKTNESFVYLRNISNTYSGSSPLDHPHVRESRPCLGNLKEEVPRMIKSSDFIGVFLLMYDYLTTVNCEGWYETITRWRELPIINRETGSIDDEDETDEEETADEHQAQTEAQNV